MFRSKAWKWLVLGGAITVILLYMLEMTTTGIERVYGPLDETAAAAQSPKSSEYATGLIPIQADDKQKQAASSDASVKGSSGGSAIDQEIAALEAEIAELKRLALLKEKEELQQKLLINEDAAKPAVNRMADSTSEVLQSASSTGLQFIANLFSKVID